MHLKVRNYAYLLISSTSIPLALVSALVVVALVDWCVVLRREMMNAQIIHK